MFVSHHSVQSSVLILPESGRRSAGPSTWSRSVTAMIASCSSTARSSNQFAYARTPQDHPPSGHQYSSRILERQGGTTAATFDRHDDRTRECAPKSRLVEHPSPTDWFS